MRFLIDAQLPPALARWIAERGHEAEHVGDVGLARASDAEIWKHAEATGSVIVTKDEDFARRRALSAAGPQILWVRLPNTRRQALLDAFATIWRDVVAAVERGEPVVEIT